MGKFVIFCAAEFDELLEPLGSGDYLLAADGGLRHLEKLNLKPHGILGDFDSLGYVPEGAVVYPVEKDDTDSILAIKKGIEMGCNTFYLYGALEGKRLDHTMANFQALQYLAQQGLRGWLVGNRQIATVICNSAVTFPPCCIQYLSVFCMGKDAQGVSIRGMQYNMENKTLSSGFPLGVSNQFVQKKATVEVKDGSLLLMWHRKNGIH